MVEVNANGRYGWRTGWVQVITAHGHIRWTGYIYMSTCLAVVPLHQAGGWIIVHTELGLRISCGGRVVVDPAIAFEIVEEIEPLLNDWKAFFSPTWFASPAFLEKFTKAHTRHEPYGFLPMNVRPKERH